LNINQINSFILARTNEHKILFETLGETESCLKYIRSHEIIEFLNYIICNFMDLDYLRIKNLFKKVFRIIKNIL
jgi:hypothetical protein